MSQTTCQRQNLVQQGPIQIDQYGCGTLHITVGPCTLRLPPAAAEVLCLALLEAMRQIESRADSRMQ